MTSLAQDLLDDDETTDFIIILRVNDINVEKVDVHRVVVIQKASVWRTIFVGQNYSGYTWVLKNDTYRKAALAILTWMYTRDHMADIPEDLYGPVAELAVQIGIDDLYFLMRGLLDAK